MKTSQTFGIVKFKRWTKKEVQLAIDLMEKLTEEERIRKISLMNYGMIVIESNSNKVLSINATT